MNNAEKFEQEFGIYATELWSKSETDFLEWLNAPYKEKKHGEWIPYENYKPKKDGTYLVRVCRIVCVVF